MGYDRGAGEMLIDGKTSPPDARWQQTASSVPDKNVLDTAMIFPIDTIYHRTFCWGPSTGSLLQEEGRIN